MGYSRGMSEHPLFSIVVAVPEGSAHLLPFTLDSILSQDFARFEIILVDGQTSENTTIASYQSKIHQVIFAKSSNVFAMMNQALTLVKGEYVHFLLPGEYYLSRHALTFQAKFIETNPSSDLIACGCMQRHSMSPSQVLMEPLSRLALKGGKISPSLQAYWFRKTAIESVGGFRTFFALQSGFDLICRLYLAPNFEKMFFRRVLTDYEYRFSPLKKIIRNFLETLAIIIIYFGLSPALVAWMARSNLRLLSWGWKNVKGAFWKRSPAN